MNQLLNEIRKKDAKASPMGENFTRTTCFPRPSPVPEPEIQISRGNQVPKDFDGIVFDIEEALTTITRRTADRENGVPYGPSAFSGRRWGRRF